MPNHCQKSSTFSKGITRRKIAGTWDGKGCSGSAIWGPKCRQLLPRAESWELRAANCELRTASEIALADFGPNLIWLRWRAFMEQIYNNFQISMKTGTENC